MSIRNNYKEAVSSILILLSMILIVVDAAIPQLTHLIFSSYIRIDFFLKVFLLIIISVHIVTSKNVKMKYLINITVFVFLIYLSVDLLYQLRVNDLPYIVNGYNAFFFFAFVLYFSSFTIFYIKREIFLSVIILFGLISAVIGILQYSLNTPLLGLGDGKSGFQVLSSTFYGSSGRQIRGFGLFNSGLGAGIYLIFLLPITIYLGNRKKLYLILTIIFLLAIFCTLTRNIYLGASIAVFSSIMYIYLKNNKLLFCIPILFLFIAFLGLYTQSFGGSSGGILDNTSRAMRQDQSTRELSIQNQSGLLDYVLGEGLYQSESTDASKRILIDNTYLHLIKHVGFLGFMIFLLVYLALLYISIRNSKTSINCGFYCFLAAWPAMALYNILINELLIYSALVLLFAFSEYGRSSLDKKIIFKIQEGR